MKRTLLLALLAVLLQLVANAYSFEKDGIFYKINSDATSVSVTYGAKSSNSYSGDVVIPPTVTFEGKEYIVTTIDILAFKQCTDLTSVIIPETVTRIGSWAFAGSYSLESIVIPNSVTRIDGGAFESCYGLRSVRLSDSLTTLGGSAFIECVNLESINIPNSLTCIGVKAFYSCSNLKTVIIPKSVTKIENNAFNYCISLKDLYCLPEQVPETSANAFDGCYMESVTLYVPASAADDYKAAEPWSRFGTFKDAFVVGDANGNGKVEIGDITSVLTLMANPVATGYSNMAADANQSGGIEIGDITAILTIMAGE